MPHTQQPVDRAGCWFLRSGIQSEAGGVARYYRADLGQNARVSTEITGYAVSALVYLYDRRGDQGYLDAARRAGDFLAGQAWCSELQTIPFEHGPGGESPDHRAFFFDIGIINRGLLQLWRATGEERYLAITRAAGLQMRADFLCDSGFHPILELPSKRPVSHEAHWSKGPGCYQLKSAMCWWDLYGATGEAIFLEWYRDAVERALATHEAFLPAPGEPENTVDRLHAYCYFLEGLLPLASNHREVLERGIERVSRYLRERATLFERSDVYAQLLRARIYAERLAGIELNEAEAREEASRLLTFQIGGQDTRTRGGWNFGTRRGESTPFVNPVSTSFCMQAACMWEDRLAGQPLPGTLSLV